MAEVPWGFGIAAGVQSGFGTINATIQGLTGALGIADGIILGDAESGIGESGVEPAFARVQRELSPVSGSFTRQFPTFLRRELEKLSVTVQLKGSGPIGASGLASNPVVDADMNLASNYPGLNALLRASGLFGANWAAGTGYTYVPNSVVPATVKLWWGSGSDAVAVVLQDCVCTPTFEFTPGDVALATFEISGTFVSATGAITLPTFTYGHLASISAPTLVSAAHSWGISATARGFSELSITIENAIEDVPDSNAPNGLTKRQTGRRISAEVVVKVESANEAYEQDRLGATSATTDDLTFTVGSAVGIGGEVKSFAVFLNNPNVVKTEPQKLGDVVAMKAELEATGTAANTEFELRFI